MVRIGYVYRIIRVRTNLAANVNIFRILSCVPNADYISVLIGTWWKKSKRWSVRRDRSFPSVNRKHPYFDVSVCSVLGRSCYMKHCWMYCLTDTRCIREHSPITWSLTAACAVNVRLSLKNNRCYMSQMQRTCPIYHAACEVEFKPFNRLYSRLTFSNYLLKYLLSCVLLNIGHYLLMVRKGNSPNPDKISQ